MGTSEMVIYKRKQESKKTRKHAFDQESDQEKRKHALEQKSDQEKKKRSFFQDRFFLVESVFFFSFFLLSCFLTSGGERKRGVKRDGRSRILEA